MTTFPLGGWTNVWLFLAASSLLVGSHNDNIDPTIGGPPRNTRFCVSQTDDTFVCSKDPYQTITKTRPNDYLGEEFITAGVPQRIDGTESEQAAIKQVLRQMTHYFHAEVLSMPEYESIRSQCQNRNELCAFWASLGECESNRIFMIPNCAVGCDSAGGLSGQEP